MTLLRTVLLTTACLVSLPAFALSDAGQQQLQQLQTRWAEINYQTPKAQREAAFEKLGAEADAAVKVEPKAAELLVWRGIILSTWAGAQGGRGALGLAKQAKASLEEAMAIDPRAQTMLLKALEITPDGLDPNYFDGDYLFREKRYAKARTALQHALAAADRPGRAVADKGRRDEARALLAKVQAEMD